jgi:hypothetical protein
MKPWRVGRKVGRTIYEQQGTEPTDTDLLIGVMDTRELAAAAVEAHNRQPDLAALRAAVAALDHDAWWEPLTTEQQAKWQAVLDAARAICQDDQ